jgi:hypothetical protein
LNAVPAVYVTIKPLGSEAEGTKFWPNLQKVEFDHTEFSSGEMRPNPDNSEMEVYGLAPGSYLLAEPSGDGMPHTSGLVDVEKNGQVIEPRAHHRPQRCR